MKDNIRKIRKAKKLLQRDLAIGVNCSPIDISRYESETREPDLDMAFRIAKYLNVSMEELFLPEDKP